MVLTALVRVVLLFIFLLISLISRINRFYINMVLKAY